MEHIVQFAINIDDKTIQERIEEHAYQDILNNLERKALNALGSGPYAQKDRLNTLTYGAIQQLVARHKDEIIDKAAEMLADKFSRTKKYREAMGDAIAKDGE